MVPRMTLNAIRGIWQKSASTRASEGYIQASSRVMEIMIPSCRQYPAGLLQLEHDIPISRASSPWASESRPNSSQSHDTFPEAAGQRECESTSLRYSQSDRRAPMQDGEFPMPG